LKTSALPLALIVIFVRVAVEYLVFFAINHADRLRFAIILALAPARLGQGSFNAGCLRYTFFQQYRGLARQYHTNRKKTRITFNQENSSL